MPPPRAPTDDYDYRRRESRESLDDSRNGSGRSRTRKSRWSDSESSLGSESDSDRKGAPPRKGSLKSRLGIPKKKNEPTGLTITLSRSNDKDKKRKRSYESLDSDSDATSEVWSLFAFCGNLVLSRLFR